MTTNQETSVESLLITKLFPFGLNRDVNFYIFPSSKQGTWADSGGGAESFLL